MDFRERAREEAESIIRSLFAIVKVNLVGDSNSGGDKKDRYWKYFGAESEEHFLTGLKKGRKLTQSPCFWFEQWSRWWYRYHAWEA